MLDYARRFQSLQQELDNSLAELRDNSAGRLTIGANESTTLYLLQHIERYRELYPKVKVQVRRSLSSKIPNELLDGNLELGVISYDPGDERLKSKVIYTDALAFVVSPKHRLAHRKTVSHRPSSASETFIAHNVVSPYRDVVLREFQAHKVPLHMDVEMPTIETIRKLVQSNVGRRVPAAHVRGAGDRAEAALRGAREGDARRAQDPPDLSDPAGAEPRGEGFSRSRRMRLGPEIVSPAPIATGLRTAIADDPVCVLLPPDSDDDRDVRAGGRIRRDADVHLHHAVDDARRRAVVLDGRGYAADSCRYRLNRLEQARAVDWRDHAVAARRSRGSFTGHVDRHHRILRGCVAGRVDAEILIQDRALTAARRVGGIDTGRRHRPRCK